MVPVIQTSIFLLLGRFPSHPSLPYSPRRLLFLPHFSFLGALEHNPLLDGPPLLSYL
jgi:hypothetical protein